MNNTVGGIILGLIIGFVLSVVWIEKSDDQYEQAQFMEACMNLGSSNHDQCVLRWYTRNGLLN